MEIRASTLLRNLAHHMSLSEESDPIISLGSNPYHQTTDILKLVLSSLTSEPQISSIFHHQMLTMNLRRSTIGRLPLEMLTSILTYLDPEKDLLKSFLYVSRECYQIVSRGDTLWADVSRRTWPSWCPTPSPSSWYRTYLRRTRSEALWLQEEEQCPRGAILSGIGSNSTNITNNPSTRMIAPPPTPLHRGVHCLALVGSELLCGSGFQNEILSWNMTSRTVANLPSGFMGHKQAVTSIVAVPDSDLILSGSLDGTARVWSHRHQTLLKTFQGHSEKVWCVDTLGENTSRAVSGSSDRSVRIWDTTTGEECCSLLDFRTSVSCVKSNGSWVVCGSAGNTLRVWDVTTQAILAKLRGHSKGVFCVQFDAHKILSGSLDNRIILWDVRGGFRPVHVMNMDVAVGSGGEITETGVICLSYDDTKLVAGGPDQLVKLVDLRKIMTSSSYSSSPQPPSPIVRIFRGHEHWVTSLCFDAPKGILISGSRDKTLRTWCVHSPGDGAVGCVAQPFQTPPVPDNTNP